MILELGNHLSVSVIERTNVLEPTLRELMEDAGI